VGDFIYLDPPYVVSSRRVFAEYTADSFSAKDLVRLGRALDRLDEEGVDFLVSYADCAESRKLFSRWRVNRIRTRRNIAGFAGQRRNSYELVATNMEC
jgi:DNA adenine methylase